MKVYVVIQTTEYYDDYSLIGVYSSIEKAIEEGFKYLKKISWDNYDIKTEIFSDHASLSDGPYVIDIQEKEIE